MNNNLLTVLSDIAKALNSSNIFWGVGASLLLRQYGLEDNPTDIDILVGETDIYTADKIISQLGIKQPETTSDIYSTDFFREYKIDGICVDIMAGFKINIENRIFKYDFKPASVPHKFSINGISIPFTTLEEWYVLYQLMPNKQDKVKKTAEYLRKTEIRYPELLHQLEMNPDLPENVKQNIRSLFDNEVL